MNRNKFITKTTANKSLVGSRVKFTASAQKKFRDDLDAKTAELVCATHGTIMQILPHDKCKVEWDVVVALKSTTESLSELEDADVRDSMMIAEATYHHFHG